MVVELSLAEHSHGVKNNFIWSFTFILQRWRLQMNFTHHTVGTGCDTDHPQFWSVYFDTSIFLSKKHLLILKRYKVNVFQSSFFKKKKKKKTTGSYLHSQIVHVQKKKLLWKCENGALAQTLQKWRLLIRN